MTCTLLGVVTALHSEPTGLLAQAAQGGGGLMAMSNLLLPVFLIGIFYFILIRPQQKRQRELEDWRKGIKRGDEIITSGGLWARIPEWRNHPAAGSSARPHRRTRRWLLPTKPSSHRCPLVCAVRPMVCTVLPRAITRSPLVSLGEAHAWSGLFTTA